MLTAIRVSGTPDSCACSSISVSPHDDTPARKASLFVNASGCGRDEESSTRVAPCPLLTARPSVPLLSDRTTSILSSGLMVSSCDRCDGPASLPLCSLVSQNEGGSIENRLVALQIQRPGDVLERWHFTSIVDTDLTFDHRLELGAHREHEVLALSLLRREVHRLGGIRLEIEQLDIVVPIQLVERTRTVPILGAKVAGELVPAVEDRSNGAALLQVRRAAAPEGGRQVLASRQGLRGRVHPITVDRH